MINLHNICYLRLGVSSLDTMVDWATRVFGLELRGCVDNRAYLRGDSSVCNICYIEDDIPDVAAFEMRTLADMEHAAQVLSKQGVDTRWGTDVECKVSRWLPTANLKPPFTPRAIRPRKNSK